jgi:Ca2+-binding RTX toxin-like protein
MQNLESLERRQLLAGVTVVLSPDKGGILRIAGTSGDDSVQVALKGKLQFTVSDGTQTLTYDRAAVKKLTFIGGDGNDAISLGRVPLKFYGEGGNGNDSLSASNGDSPDTLFGNAGNDYLYAGPGTDNLDGGTGPDLMFGSDGDDVIAALSDASHDDTISGGLGSDTVTFGQYTAGVKVRVGVLNAPSLSVHDVLVGDIEIVNGSMFADRIGNESGHPMRLFGSAGDDIITSGSAGDEMVGGFGRDSMLGNGGNDLFVVNGDNTPDTINGGSGSDSAYYDNDDVVKSIESKLQAPLS